MLRALLFALASACLFAFPPTRSAAAESAINPAAEGPDEAAVATAVKALKVREGETIVFVTDLHCATCAKKVTSRLFKLKGVMRVRTSVKLDAAVITPQTKKTIDVAAAWEALQEAGYQPTHLAGPEGVFIAHDEDLTPVKIAEAPTPRRN
jgi:copper chaperone CopZ